MADSGMNRVVEHLLQVAGKRGGGDLTDGQLLECFLAGRDNVAFEALVNRHGPMVLGVCRRVLRHAHDAEDAFQATFLVLVRKGAGIWPRTKVGNWLYGVAYRIALKARAMRLKTQAREKPLDDRLECQGAPSDPALDWLPALDRELNGLPAKYRVPIILCDLEGQTQHDAARQLGWRQGTLSGRLSRARVLLCQRLSKRGLTLSLAGLTTTLSAQGVAAAVPSALVAGAVKAATFSAIKQAVSAGVISAHAAALTEGALKAMLWSKLKVGLIGFVAVALVATGLGRALAPATGQSKVPVPRAGAAEMGGKVLSPQAKELAAKLRVVGKFHYKNMNLGNLLDELRNKRGINVILDHGALAPQGIAPEVEVSLQLNDVPLESALRYLLKPVGLDFVTQDGVLVVTARGKAMILKTYPVATLLGKDDNEAAQGNNAQALIQVIAKTIEPETWSESGGAASIEYFPGTRFLVVRHSFEVHRQIEELLTNLAEK